MDNEILVKLKKPIFTKTFGQGNPPEGMSISTQAANYFLPWGCVLKLSDTCDEENKIADLDLRPVPLLHKKFYEENKNSFEIIDNI